jgi:hypothetical protein
MREIAIPPMMFHTTTSRRGPGIGRLPAIDDLHRARRPALMHSKQVGKRRAISTLQPGGWQCSTRVSGNELNRNVLIERPAHEKEYSMKKALALAAAAVLGLMAATAPSPAEAGGLIVVGPGYGYCGGGYYEGYYNAYYGVRNPVLCYSHGVRPVYVNYGGARFYGPRVYHRHYSRRSIWP